MLKKLFYQIKEDLKGAALLYVMVFGALSFSFIVIALSGYTISEYKATVHKENMEKAFHIAEAGIDYYKWHLMKNPEDYQDGTGQPGPYEKDFFDKDGNLIGKYLLNIIPPANSSTVVTLESTGWLVEQPQSKRTIRAKVSFPSLTEFALVSNTDLWLSSNAQVTGKLHSNSGLRFEGVTNAPITSAVESYMCSPVHSSGCTNQEKDGIWCTGQNCTESSKFFQFPVPAVDFGGAPASLAQIRSGAESGGVLLPASGKQGWLLHFTSDGKVQASKVNATLGYKGDDVDGTKNVTYNVDIKLPTDAPTTYDLPQNGYIYVEDTAWIDGVLRGKVTVGVKSGKSIIINDNIVYSSKDGSDRLGLITDKDILIPHNSPNNLEINGALYAAGSVKRYYYSGDKKNVVSVYGAVASNGPWIWSWVAVGGEAGVASGYDIVSSTHDVNLVRNPPAAFPRGTSYNLVSWEEVK